MKHWAGQEKGGKRRVLTNRSSRDTSSLAVINDNPPCRFRSVVKSDSRHIWETIKKTAEPLLLTYPR